MIRLNRNSSMLLIFVMALYCSCILSGCDDDDLNPNNGVAILPYDGTKHIYGAISIIGDGMWEVVIDPVTGQFSKIEETEEVAAGIDFPIGTKSLTAFERNKRIFIPFNGSNSLRIQDLATFETVDIELRDSTLEESMTFPQIIRFGANEQEVFITDSDNSLWKIDLEDESVTKVYNRVPIATDCGIKNFFFVPITNQFLMLTNTGNVINDYSVEELFLLDPTQPDAEAVVNDLAIVKGFGFVQSPTDKSSFYYIKLAEGDEGFRLMRAQLTGENISTTQLSTTDLAIDNLSSFLQTIQTATNAYILRGGSSSIEMPNNTLYTIDLDSGELINEVDLENSGILLKLAGE